MNRGVVLFDHSSMKIKQVTLLLTMFRGGSRIFFRRGCTRLLLYFNTNKPHSVFFLQNTSYIRKPQVISRRGAHPLHPPPRSAPDVYVIPGRPGYTLSLYTHRGPSVKRSRGQISGRHRWRPGVTLSQAINPPPSCILFPFAPGEKHTVLHYFLL